MSNRNRLSRRSKMACVMALLSVGLATPLLASVSISYQTDPSQGAFSVSNSDLINSNSVSLLSTSDSGFTPFSFDGGTSTTSALNDGVQGLSFASGNGALSSGAFDLDGTWTTTFYLDAGYDLRQLDTIASWPAARASQAYQVSVRQVGNPVFTLLATVDFEVSPDQSSKIVITDTAGTLAYNVDAIQFDFTVATGSASGRETVYRELDVFGVPTVVPEPSSVGLALAGGAMLLLWRFKKS